MTVFIVQNHASYDHSTGLMVPRYDFSPAEKFGKLEYLLSPITVPSRSERVIATLRKKLCNFCDNDFLLLVGNPCLIAFAATVAADQNDGRINLLQWNGSERKYHMIQAAGLIEVGDE